MDGLSAGMIFVAVLALVILLSLVVYTWVKWRRNEISKAANTGQSSQENGSVGPPTYAAYDAEREKSGFDNIASKMKSMESITGSRTILTEQGYKTGDIVYNSSLHDPTVFRSSDVVYHTDRPQMLQADTGDARDRSKTWL